MELPLLEQLWRKYRDEGISIVAIESRRQRDLALKFIKENKLTYHLLENLEGEREVVRGIFDVNGFPTTFIIDRNGGILYSHIGFSKEVYPKLEKEVADLLKRDGNLE